MKQETRDFHVEIDLSKELADPDYYADMVDPLRAAKGLFAMMFLAVLFWGGLCFIVAAVNTYIGGG